MIINKLTDITISNKSAENTAAVHMRNHSRGRLLSLLFTIKPEREDDITYINEDVLL